MKRAKGYGAYVIYKNILDAFECIEKGRKTRQTYRLDIVNMEGYYDTAPTAFSRGDYMGADCKIKRKKKYKKKNKSSIRP